jgi:hypothetical protein
MLETIFPDPRLPTTAQGSAWMACWLAFRKRMHSYLELRFSGLVFFVLSFLFAATTVFYFSNYFKNTTHTREKFFSYGGFGSNGVKEKKSLHCTCT